MRDEPEIIVLKPNSCIEEHLDNQLVKGKPLTLPAYSKHGKSDFGNTLAQVILQRPHVFIFNRNKLKDKN